MLTDKPTKKVKPRKDKLRNIAKVAKVVLANPLLNRDEVAKKAGVATGTASNMLKELDEIGHKDDRIVGLNDLDIQIEQLATKEIINRLVSKTDEVTNMELAKFNESATKRRIIFGAKADDGASQSITIQWQL